MFLTAQAASPGRVRTALLGIACLLTAAGCSSHGAPAVEPAASQGSQNPFIEVAPAGAAGRSWGNALPGRLIFRPLGVAAVAATVDARVASIDTRLGATVKAGDTLLTLKSSDAAKARADLISAEASAAAAEDTLRRQTELVARGVGLEVERFAAETDLKQARAELESARGAVALLGPGEGDRLVLKAPAAGVVLSLHATVGAVVSHDGEPLVEIGDPKAVWVQADVPETVIGTVRVGGAARVRVGAADAAFDAVIDGFGPRVNDEQRRAAVYLRPVSAPQGLVPGMLAEVELDGGDAAGISLPVEAVLIKNGTDRVVYVREGDGHYRARKVRTGTESDGHVTILEGLSAGENVVVRGALLLDDDAEQLL
ncbi:MAG TPA: efflux RND transporter periplasmic adaptor subunit [Gammaproteobacteria bacterium]|jgi:cobalt-zinc-cadmium efflux system membrane fusion protein|nr:efflux RND transporter periplasmic adaptor subunit [Gammaproteobacteria bacterium]